MPLVQLDLFGWHQTQDIPTSTRDEISVDDLADNLIKYFGHWIQNHPRLLKDDSTVCETLITIHKRYTFNQLAEIYKTPIWFKAWERFNQFYLTNRSEGGFYFGDWLKGWDDEPWYKNQIAGS